MAVLLLDGEGELIGELLAVPGATGLTVFLMDLKFTKSYLYKNVKENKTYKN